jgi:acetyl-CoA carboxylase biotin carboxyl carrier protein
MDRKELEELIRLVEDSDVQELQIRTILTSVRIVKTQPHLLTAQSAAVAAPAHAVPAPAPALADTASEPLADAPASHAGAGADLVPVTSPMVGTFYAASSPESPPYVKQGDHISKGQVVGIVEAMKLMNEIESEVHGTIVRVIAQNATPVEFGETLFMVRPD